MVSRRLSTFLWFLSVLYATIRARNVTVCPGTKLSTQNLAEYSRKNCTVIEGPLILYESKPNNASIVPLSSIVEITGTLEVYFLGKNVDNLGQILPNLAVIRGHPHHRYHGISASVVISINQYLRSINLANLTHIQGEDQSTVPVSFFNNKNLQFIHTVEWGRIASNGRNAFFYENSEEDGECPTSCSRSCWSDTSCQKLLNCSAVDPDGKCDCHEECLSSCPDGRTEYDCISCKHYHYQGRCVSTCPRDTFVVAGWRCVDKCPYVELNIVQSGTRKRQPLFAFNGTCVIDCPGDYTEDNDTKTCVPCSDSSNCETRCSGGTISSISDASRFEGCVHVEGSLKINILTESDNEGNLSRYLGSIEHVDGYVAVVNSPRLKTLEFLDNLTSIGGQELEQIGSDLYGLAIVNNWNLRSVSWKQQKNLWLGGRTDVEVLVHGNYLACSDTIEDLASLFPYFVKNEDNSILAICNTGHLNLTAEKDNSGSTYLHWDPVPPENRTYFIAYQILWQSVGIVKSIPDPLPEEYDDINPEGCENTWWRSESVGNVTSYKLKKEMLPPWKTVVFQVRAEFSRRGIGFKSDLVSVNGTLAVPSCPIIEKISPGKDSNVTVYWRSPKYYSENVTHYRISFTQIYESCSDRHIEDNFTKTSEVTDCSADTTSNELESDNSCISNYTLHNDFCNGTGGLCERTFSELEPLNYVRYQVQIQAINPGGCGVAGKGHFATLSDYEQDKVYNLTITRFSGPSPSTENVTVSLERPENPNGGCLRLYEVDIEFHVSKQEQIEFQHSHDQWVLPQMNKLGCIYTSGTPSSYFCKIRSTETTVSIQLTLIRVPDRELSYTVIVNVVSALDKKHFDSVRKQLTVAEDPSGTSTNQQGKSTSTAIIVMVVLVCLVLIIVVLVYALWRQKRKRRYQLRNGIGGTPLSVDGEALLAREYVPDEWEIQRDEISLSRELGRGEFGLVYQGTWQNPDGKRPLAVAVKTLSDESSSEDRLLFLQEASVMKHFSSNHIVRLLGIVSQGTPVMVVMELMTRGDLKGYLRSLRPEDEEAISFKTFPISEEELLQMTVQIASGMVYLTNKKFVHRDLAARNCMVTGDVRIKIGDFGLTRDVYQSDYYRKRGRGALPVRWMPPESLRDGVFTLLSDIWSFGIVLWEVATLAMQPYPGKSNSEVFEYVVGGGVMDISEMEYVPSTLLIIMERCWLYKPSDRPTFEDILGCLPPLDGAEIQV